MEMWKMMKMGRRTRKELRTRAKVEKSFMYVLHVEDSVYSIIPFIFLFL